MEVGSDRGVWVVREGVVRVADVRNGWFDRVRAVNCCVFLSNLFCGLLGVGWSGSCLGLKPTRLIAVTHLSRVLLVWSSSTPYLTRREPTMLQSPSTLQLFSRGKRPSLLRLEGVRGCEGTRRGRARGRRDWGRPSAMEIIIVIVILSMSEQAGESKSASKKEIEKQGIEFSLLDITYPYYHSSMLSKSKFFGFECLMFECGIYFCLLYTVANFLNRGYILQWHTLDIITSNLYHDASAMTTGLILAFVQMYLARPLLALLRTHPQQTKLLYLYCGLWLLLFVVGGLMVMQTVQFYFTDRIFIVVVSWSLPVKTGSYCIDQLQMSNNDIAQPPALQQARKRERAASPLGRLVLQLKFIVSPQVIYKQFLMDHNPALPVHLSYLFIKAIVAGICLLINYILMTEFIAPYLQPEVHGKMSFIELFFKLIPLAFYVNICLYYLIMENIMLAMAEITQLQRRHFYHDWWNAETVSEFLDKWVLLIAAFSNTYLPTTVATRWKHLLHLVIIFLMLFSVFGEELNLKMVIFAGINMGTVFFLGENRLVQNNYLVHILTISFTPFSLAAELKYSIFS